ncbi:cobalamin biosynthesis protein, partial [Streptomyces sp. NPDC051098]|uniref:cobalamin biosynthesis protein n=1 Tax=Streptomyces sp. NPDC051098 TaxID=3155411 RepID=UPI0034259AED
MRADRVFVYGSTAGLACDLLLGDPRRGHPVAAFGRAAEAVERALWRDHRGRGALHTLLCAGGAAAGTILRTVGVELPHIALVFLVVRREAGVAGG